MEREASQAVMPPVLEGLEALRKLPAICFKQLAARICIPLHAVVRVDEVDNAVVLYLVNGEAFVGRKA